MRRNERNLCSMVLSRSRTVQLSAKKVEMETVRTSSRKVYNAELWVVNIIDL
jgi:hypothetical protein